MIELDQDSMDMMASVSSKFVHANRFVKSYYDASWQDRMVLYKNEIRKELVTEKDIVVAALKLIKINQGDDAAILWLSATIYEMLQEESEEPDEPDEPDEP